MNSDLSPVRRNNRLGVSVGVRRAICDSLQLIHSRHLSIVNRKIARLTPNLLFFVVMKRDQHAIDGRVSA